MQSRMAGDVNHDEEAEMERMVPPGPGNYTTPAPGLPPNVTWTAGSSEGGNPPPFPAHEINGEPSPQPSPAAAADNTAAGSQADDAVDDDDSEPPPPPREVAPMPPTFPAHRHGMVSDQAANIKTQLDARRGINTYKTSWKDYDKYHMLRYGVPAPRCPWTGLLWLTTDQGVQYVSHMAREKKSAAQASPLAIAHCYGSLAPVLCATLLSCYPLLTGMCMYCPWLWCQMSSARSALNYLLNAWHSIARIGDPDGTPVWHAKLTTKDAVSLPLSLPATLVPATCH